MSLLALDSLVPHNVPLPSRAVLYTSEQVPGISNVFYAWLNQDLSAVYNREAGGRIAC